MVSNRREDRVWETMTGDLLPQVRGGTRPETVYGLEVTEVRGVITPAPRSVGRGRW